MKKVDEYLLRRISDLADVIECRNSGISHSHLPVSIEYGNDIPWILREAVRLLRESGSFE